MKSSNSILLYGIILLLATGLTVLSLRFVRPADCQQLCDAPEQSPCPRGACRFGEQRAGLPLPVLIDDMGGSSPTSGWGILGPEDLPNPLTFVLDVLFYSVLLGLFRYIIQVLRGRERPLKLTEIMPLLAFLLVFILVGFILYRPFLSR